MGERYDLGDVVIVSGLADLDGVKKQFMYECYRGGFKLVSLTYHPTDKYVAVFHIVKENS